KMFSNAWMRDLGFISEDSHGDLRDLISRKHKEHATVFVKPEDTINTAYGRMKLHDVSQVPVLDGDRIVGLVDESDVLFALFGKRTRFDAGVQEVMNTHLFKLKPSDGLKAVMELFKRGFVAIVEDDQGAFLGIITKIDLLNYLRRGKQ
ncbi:MAG TPA: CBS domain-containing protein, partial [bacterium]|nr:CBS domain-containing protein [bacterium]